MALKPKKLLGLKYSIFQDIIKGNEELHVQKARLIRFYKPGDEMALTSIFLSSLKMVDPYRKNIFKTIILSNYGKLHIFTKVEFVHFNHNYLYPVPQ